MYRNRLSQQLSVCTGQQACTATALCAQITAPTDGCKLINARREGAGTLVPETAATFCAECGLGREDIGGVWLYDWSNRPVCHECLDDLEWCGLLEYVPTSQ